MTQALKQDYRTSPESPPRPIAPPAPPPPTPTRGQRRRWSWLFLGPGLLLGLAVTVQQAGMLSTPAPPAPAVPIKRESVTALGWLEPSSDIIKLAPPATVEASRIARLMVDEGDYVAAGQAIAELDTADKLRAQIKLSEAQVELKRVSLERVRLDTENGTVSRRMAVARAKSDLDQAEAEFARQKALSAKEIASAANLEKRKRDLEVARSQFEENMAALKRVEATTPVKGDTPEQIDIAVAQRELAAAQADLVQAQVLLDQASIRTPIAGQILTVLSRPGEKVSQEGVVEVGATDSMVVVAEVYQSDIKLIHLGQSVGIKADLLPDSLTGHVERIGLKIKRQSVINNDPATDTDSRVVEVRIKLDPASSQRVSSLSRLQVRAYFKLEVK